MIIDFLELANFISHVDTEINFSGGINVILGNNGAGKSSMMDGIRFALFGDSGRGNNSDLIHHGSTTSTVRLGFHVSEDRYEITRKITVTKGDDSKTDAEMRRNDEIYANGSKAVNAAVESLFRISRDLFFSSIFVRQGEIDQLVSEKPADRKKLFSQIIGIDELQRKAELIKALERRIRAGSESYIVDMVEFGQRKSMLESKKQELAGITESLSALNSRHKESVEKLGTLRKDLEESRSALIGLKQKAEGLRKTQEELQKQEKALSELRETKKKYSESDSEYRKIESEGIYRSRELIKSVDSDMRDAAHFTEQLRELARRLQEIKKLKERRSELSSAHESFLDSQKELAALEAEISRARDFTTEYSGKLLEAERKAGELKVLEKRASDARELVPEKYRTMSRRELKDETVSLNNRRNELASRKGSMEAELVHLGRAMEELSGKSEMLQGQKTCPVCGSQLTEEHMQKVLSDYNSEKERLNLERKKISEALDQLTKESGSVTAEIDHINSGNVSDYAELEEELLRIKKEIERLKTALSEGSNRWAESQGREKSAQALRDKLREMEPLNTEYTSLEAAIRALEAENSVQRIEELKNKREPVEKRYKENLEAAGISEDQVPKAMESIREMERRVMELKPQVDSSSILDESIRELEITIRTASTEAESLREAASLLPEAENRFNQINDRYESEESSIRDLKSRIDSLTGSSRQMGEDISYREKEIGRTEEKLKRYSAIQDSLKKLSEIRAALEKDGIQKFLRKESSEAITGKTRSLVSEFGLEIDDIRVSEDFDVEVSVAGSVESLSSLSGGEKTALAIALRLSVADYILNRVSTFIMDEPTTFLDEDRRGQLKNILQNSLRDQSIVPQLIVITHHQELTKAADMVYMVRKREGASMVEPLE